MADGDGSFLMLNEVSAHTCSTTTWRAGTMCWILGLNSNKQIENHVFQIAVLVGSVHIVWFLLGAIHFSCKREQRTPDFICLHQSCPLRVRITVCWKSVSWDGKSLLFVYSSLGRRMLGRLLVGKKLLFRCIYDSKIFLLNSEWLSTAKHIANEAILWGAPRSDHGFFGLDLTAATFQPQQTQTTLKQDS